MLIEVSFFFIFIILKFLIGACFYYWITYLSLSRIFEVQIKRHFTVIGHLKNIEQN